MLPSYSAGDKGGGNVIASGIAVQVEELTTEEKPLNILGFHGGGIDFFGRNSTTGYKAFLDGLRSFGSDGEGLEGFKDLVLVLMLNLLIGLVGIEP